MVQRLLEYQDTLEVEWILKAHEHNRGFYDRFMDSLMQKVFLILFFLGRVIKLLTDFGLRTTFVILIIFITILLRDIIYTAYHCDFYTFHADPVLAAMDTRLSVAGFE